ncbi:polysaccharide biosynthesis protein [Brevundimonas lenta]|uniref:O-antigen biosynthesis protein WbqV n=1 Tax=Brevundimonas lenta TaxID=424796 RepID=A0A7W6NRD2_9CAUL|nr:nucleoside-diphosphate sugar epimerase/dehydratase [Brevundimonas lenta]MBB4084137.1 O-antigen biosynthesis protein WbqV [Brevundimonas lenta]
MSIASAFFVRTLKVAARAGIRMAAVIGGYLVASGHAVTFSALLNSTEAAWPHAVAFAVLGFGLDLFFRTDRALWRYVSIVDVGPIVRTSVLSAGIFLAFNFFLERGASLPRSTLLIVPVLDIGMTLALVLLRRIVHDKEALRAIAPFVGARDDSMPLIIVGGMDRVETFLRELARSGEKYRPAGIVTDTAGAAMRELRGVKVLSGVKAAADILDDLTDHDIEAAIVFLDDSLAPADFGVERLGQLRTRGVHLLRVPSLVEVGGGTDEPVMRRFELEELLARPPVRLADGPLRALVAGKRVLVTGAGGSIGSEICRQVASLGCGHLVLIDNSEFGLFKIDQEIETRWPTLSRREYLYDVRNKALLYEAFGGERPDVVFHAAALKHVPMMEKHPCESVLTNVVGTWNVAEAANAAGVKHMVFISTDKAVDPPNVMGATKRLAEAVVRAQQTGDGGHTRFSVVRFGNVLGSAGSVVPTFRAQIERGGPVTLTHPDIERYFMTIPEAVQLVLHATAHSAEQPDGPLGVFVLDMGKPVKILDLARQLIGLYGKVPGKDVEIEVTGLRPGEKLFEELVDSSEVAEMCGQSLMCVTDRIQGARMTEQTVQKLERVARAGDNLATRSLIFEVLASVRTVMPDGDRPGADVVSIKRA